MQTIECPGCGAPVQFRSAASVMAVCKFCRTTLLRDADSVRNLGKMSEVIEDITPLQIGSSGEFSGRAFALVGRIQLRYAAGYWNEWYALFGDGTNGWLSDASGQYVMTFLETTDAALPVFDKLLPGRVVTLLGQPFIASDVRTAQCTAGEGELPFKVFKGWEARVADFRATDRFVTLDYSDEQPRVYAGEAVLLDALHPQMLRNAREISAAAGRLHGQVTPLTCPSCGAPLRCVPGVTVQVVCPNCRADIDTSAGTAAVLSAGAAVDRVELTLELGAEAMIGGIRYTVLGAMRRGETDGSSAWWEYLLYATGRAFLWLVETADGWQRAEVLDRWPTGAGAGAVVLDGTRYQKASEYSSRVSFAVGAFNWRVSAGDVVNVTEYAAGRQRLAAEASTEELTWSHSTALPLDQVRAWFGEHIHVDQQPHPRHVDTARRLVLALFVINIIPVFLATSNSLPYALLGAAAIYLPAYFLDQLDRKA